MPIPTPTEAEGQGEFISRCMETMAEEQSDREVRAAMCYRQWRTSKGKAEDVKHRHEAASPDPKFKVMATGEGKSGDDAGWIEGYTAVFNNVDRQGERILPGAFKKTIKERVPAGKVKLMVRHYAHGGDTLELIGTVTEAKEDEYGLWMHAELSSVAIAQETRAKITEGHVNGLSIGYVPQAWEDVEEDGEHVTNLKEVMWLESTVTLMPANELAAITAAKAVSDMAAALHRDVGAPSGKEGRVFSAANRSRIESTLSALRKLGGELEGLLEEAEPKRTGDKAALHSWALRIKRHELDFERLALGAKVFRHNSTLAEDEPSWGAVDKTKLPRLAFADMGEPDSVSSWRYPHHWVKGGGDPDDAGRYRAGTMYLHKGGVNAAWAAAQGARSGQRASQAVISHLNAHRKAIGLED